MPKTKFDPHAPITYQSLLEALENFVKRISELLDEKLKTKVNRYHPTN